MTAVPATVAMLETMNVNVPKPQCRRRACDRLFRSFVSSGHRIWSRFRRKISDAGPRGRISCLPI